MTVSGRTHGVVVIGDDRSVPLGHGRPRARHRPRPAQRVGASSARSCGSGISEQLEVEHRMVEVLQQSIIPERLPEIPETRTRGRVPARRRDRRRRRRLVRRIHRRGLPPRPRRRRRRRPRHRSREPDGAGAQRAPRLRGRRRRSRRTVAPRRRDAAHARSRLDGHRRRRAATTPTRGCCGGHVPAIRRRLVCDADGTYRVPRRRERDAARDDRAQTSRAPRSTCPRRAPRASTPTGSSNGASTLIDEGPRRGSRERTHARCATTSRSHARLSRRSSSRSFVARSPSRRRHLRPRVLRVDGPRER